MLKFVSDKRNKKTLRHCKSIPKKTKQGIDSAFRAIKPKLIRDTKKSMRKKKTGRIYRLRNGKMHQASAPNKGETPAVLTGDLMKSLACIIKYGVMLTYGANTPYARKHETTNGRSYLRRTILANNRDFRHWFVVNISRSIHKAN